jgi:DNA polymerase elongation subunit (family B)
MLTHNLGYRSSIADKYVDAEAGERQNKPVLRPGAPPWLLALRDKDLLDVTRKGAIFIKESFIQAETTRVLRSLLAARKSVRDELKNETDDQRASVLDGKQNAFKICANSTYGYTGNPVGQMPRVQIAEGVTSFGRLYIMMCKRAIERDMPWPEAFFDYLRTKVDPVHGTTFEADCRANLYRPIVIGETSNSFFLLGVAPHSS